MTTTLRPARPVLTGADGARSAAYTVCVNSRPVGAVGVGTDRRYGPTVGRIDALTIDEPDRRRGRGTVAALAAEEVLRQWGCTRVETTVGAGMPYALRMAAALGYTERNRTMLLALPARETDDRPPAGLLPPGTTLRPMREEEYAAWRDHERDGYVAALTGSGVPDDQAEREESAGFASAFPEGLASPGTMVLVLEHDGAPAGHLSWVRLADPSWVSSVEVAPEYRGRGFGRALMRVAEELTRKGGATTLGLNVFAGNAPALHLYASLGYRTTDHHFSKPLL
ncbi:putative acetyltransferase [Actinacidiphila reveromycinica]|uniref:Putative acetyltransferase n=1 Tax=Actinacidiphila reveromycinica TaxID=659352 RepID=A0A7U3UNZ2_9ACTN|nr:GNAT family N-acetyltransferase [Streptomyces sp. SN-593]BBA96059.1 putative acetyltransferase [Streptomyces sp. SN-593]